MTKEKMQNHFTRLALLCALCLFGFQNFAQTPVATNGALRVSGNRIVNKNGQAVSLSGPSYFWSNTGWGAERFYNASVVNYFRSNWNAGVIRAAMGAVPVDGGGSYLADASNKTRVKAVVDAAISAGMYVIIDWHTHHAESYQTDAVNFFKEMAQTYGTRDNVIYEIYNEPLAVSWSGTIKPYAQAVISAIRSIDPDNLIIVGTPNWSQDVDVAANDPITGYSNIAYTLHFYAATHKASLRAKASTALSRGIALFVTEWGTCDASGSGFVDEASTNEWVNFMKANGISNCNWSIHDKAESASILNGGVSSTGNWTDANLTASGRIVKNIVLNWGGAQPPPACTSVSLPSTIQAESYCSMSGVQLENTTDSGGGQNVGWIDAGDWMSYSINAPSTGTYAVQYRVASASGGGSIRLEGQGGSPVFGTITVPSTSGWQNWQTITQTVQLTAGQQNIAIAAVAGGFNLNWFSITPNSNPSFSLTVQAESYNEMLGVQTETTSDAGGGLNVGWIETNDWMKYNSINVPTTGSYTFEFRVASPNSTGVLSHDLNSGAIQLGTINIPNTGGWQNWQTISRTVTLNAGTYSFGIFANGGGWNLNWWRISKPAAARLASSEDAEVEEVKIYPNPADAFIQVDGLSENVIKVSIVDITGKEFIAVHPDKAKQVSINIQGLNSGIHFLKVDERSSSKVKRFVKR